MKVYELMVIVSGALDEDKYKKTVEDLEKLIKTKKGTVTALDEWGKRKLAYPILKQDFGYYLVWRFTSEGATVPADIQSSLKINDAVLRAMITLAPTKKKPFKAETKSEDKIIDAEKKPSKTKKDTQITDSDTIVTESVSAEAPTIKE